MKLAIEYFHNQTYDNRELLIVADGEDVEDLIPKGRLVQIPEGSTIGKKRNIGCEVASGELIAHWDDDDYYSRNYLDDQVNRLVSSSKSVVAYNQVLFTDRSHWWRFSAGRAGGIGSSLVYKKMFWKNNPFRDRQICEDGYFISVAWSKKQLETAHADTRMVATIHPGNTSPRKTFRSEYTPLRNFVGVPEMKWPEAS